MIPVLEIIRLEEGVVSGQGTIGILKINKVVCCFTLEPSDKLNLRGKSSIPAQQYICKRYNSPRHGETFMVMDVPGRTHILFHKGNVEKDTEGCILLGDKVGKLRGNMAVLNSGNTFKQFMELLDGHDTLHLTVSEKY